MVHISATDGDTLTRERVALGALLLAASRADADAVDELRAALPDPAAFTLPEHARLWRATCATIDAGEPVVVEAVVKRLRGEHDATDLAARLVGAVEACIAPLTDGLYSARAVAEAAKKRELATRLHRLTTAAEDGETVEGIIAGVRGLAADAEAMGGSGRDDDEMTIGEMMGAYPTLHTPVIDGIVRAGETCNIIAPSKAGKSWLTYGLALSIVTGTEWLGRYTCTAGRVLVIDNELHRPTIAKRIPWVAEAMGVGKAAYADRLVVRALRGRGVDLHQLARYVQRIERGRYAAIICDAWYRFIPAGLNENSNADVMQLYNRLDQYAEATGAAWVVVHHSSKGNQSEKSVTDTGAGAGAQSRAADSHLVLRPHEEPDHVVLDAAVRSFAPIEPIVLQWSFPIWRAVDGADPSALRGRKSRKDEEQDKTDAEGRRKLIDALTGGPMTVRKLRDATGISKDRVDRLLTTMHAADEVTYSTIRVRGNDAREYRLSD